MKKKYGLMFAIFTASIILPVATTVAMDDSMPTDTSNNTTQTTQTTQNTQADDKFEIQEDTKSADFQKKLEERLTARKEALKLKLTKAQETRTKARCKAAQTAISKVTTKAKEAKTTRDEIYTKIITRATDLSAKLKENGKDTTKLDQNIKELQTLVDSFKTDMQTLRQAAVDVSAIDCTTDPTSFKASLDTLRSAREKLTSDSQAIRAYIKDNLKPTLEDTHKALGGENKEGNQSGTN